MDNNTEFNNGNNNYYSGNNQNEFANPAGNGYGNENSYGAQGYYSDAYSSADVESKVISRSFIVMFVSLLVTAATSMVVASNWRMLPNVFEVFEILLVVELAVVIGTSFAIKKQNVVLAGILYTVYTIVNGMTLSVIFLAYDFDSIKEVFVVTALLFGVMALIGATTKMDLSRVGGICTMLLLGALMVTALNMFLLHSSGVDLILDYVIVLIFVGLTAYDTQKMKAMARNSMGMNVNLIAIFCGMQLYLDFINLFLRLLSIMGKKRN